MKTIERQVIRKRLTLIKKGRAVFASAIRDQYQQAIRAVGIYPLEQLKEGIRAEITEEPIQKAFESMYVQAVDIADIWRKHLLPPTKDGLDDMYRAHIQANLKVFSRHKTASRVTGITETTRERIAQAIDYAMEEGAGVATMSDYIIENIKLDYKEFTQSRANLISQTEMITSSNEATIEAGRSTGLEMRKFWSTSGLPNVRDSHMAAEIDSNDVGGYPDGEAFSNGLLYPGDPSGDASEVCNCHCCLLLEVV